MPLLRFIGCFHGCLAPAQCVDPATGQHEPDTSDSESSEAAVMVGGTDDSSSSSSAPRGAPLASGGDDTGSEGEEEGDGEEEGKITEGFSRSGEPHFKPKKVRDNIFTHLTNSISRVGRTFTHISCISGQQWSASFESAPVIGFLCMLKKIRHHRQTFKNYLLLIQTRIILG